MKIIVRAELVTDWGETTAVEVAQFDRPVSELEPECLGLSLADGKQVLSNLQKFFVPAQAYEYCAVRSVCSNCRRQLRLDWFHISMRIRYLEQISKGMHARSETEKHTKNLLCKQMTKLRWCFWNASFKKAEEKVHQALMLCRIIVPQTPAFRDSLSHLDSRLRDLRAYIESNKSSVIAYAKRQREDKPVSTAMAESAVNEVINARMCKRQQMRWTPRGAHLLAQVRCAVINGDLPQKLAAYNKKMSEMPEHINRFLELLRAGMEREPQPF